MHEIVYNSQTETIANLEKAYKENYNIKEKICFFFNSEIVVSPSSTIGFYTSLKGSGEIVFRVLQKR